MDTTKKGIPLMRLEDIADIRQVNKGFEKIDELLDNATNVETIQNEIQKHASLKVSSPTGVHGMRYNEETEELEVEKQNGEWVGAGGGVANATFEPVTNIKIKVGNGKLTITWSDPSSSVFNTWSGTKVVYKIGSYPTKPTDGILAIDNKVKDKYKTDGFVLSNLTNDTEYYFTFFPYDTRNKFSLNDRNKAKGTPKNYDIMTVEIDMDNPNPETRCVYADNAVRMTPGSEEWDEWFGHFPCLFKNGRVVKKLLRTNRTKFEDNSNADVSSGNAGDSMVAYPRRGWRFQKVGRKLRVSMTNGEDVEGFSYYAHVRGRQKKDFFYLGAYVGCGVDGKLRSLINKSPLVRKKIRDFRAMARANGTGYDQWGVYQILFKQIAFLLKYKNTNSQNALGKGFVNMSKSTNTGATATRPMNYGTQNGNTQISFLGLEDFWGNVRQFAEGCLVDQEGNILIATDNFNDDGTGYVNKGRTVEERGSVVEVVGTNECGFIPSVMHNGSTSTYFCDWGNVYRGDTIYFFNVLVHGGEYNSTEAAGAFFCYIDVNRDHQQEFIGSRLMYL